MDINVLKKDGRLQPFDHNKIAAGLIKSGMTLENAESVAVKVEEWVQTTAQNGIVNSMDIRNKVLELLQVTDPKIAESFGSYQKVPQVAA